MKAGLRLGVVTDCSAETSVAWSSTWLHGYFDYVAFSCDLGVRKPDPRIYLTVVDALAVSPSDCIFVGDGGSQELTDAKGLGMEAIMLMDPSEVGVYRDNQEIDWRGATIDSLSELMVRLDF
jgi:putative hydrolase of the HAD superfamily